MIRNLKVLVAAAMMLTALGAAATAAQAAEFRCAAEPCTYTLKPDAAVNAHHVFVIKQGAASITATCNTIEGDGTATQVAKEITFKGIKYNGCFLAGQNATIKMNNCHYLFTNGGMLHIKGCGGGFIEIIKGNCTISIKEQSVAALTFKSIGAEPTREITMEIKGAGITGTASEECPGGIKKEAVTVEYSTGNTLLTGETAAGVFADAWFE